MCWHIQVLFYIIRLEPSSNVIFFVSLQSRHAKMWSDSHFFCAGMHLKLFFLFRGSAILTFWVFYLFCNMMSRVCAVVFCECVCGAIRPVFLESFYVRCGWCQSYVSIINVLMVTHINSYLPTMLTNSQCVFLSTFMSLQQLSVGLLRGTFTSSVTPPGGRHKIFQWNVFCFTPRHHRVPHPPRIRVGGCSAAPVNLLSCFGPYSPALPGNHPSNNSW